MPQLTNPLRTTGVIAGFMITTLLSLWAVIEAKKANKNATLQYEKSLLPVWTPEFKYSGTDLVKIKFSSLKNDLVIEKIEYWLPPNFTAPHNENLGEEWYTATFNDEINQFAQERWELSTANYQTEYAELDIPVILRFYYRREGAVQSSTVLFNMKAEAYAGKTKIRRLMYAREVLPAENCAALINEVNKTDGLGQYDFVFSPEEDSVIAQDKYIHRFQQFLEKIEPEITVHVKITIDEDTLFPADQADYVVPKFSEDSLRRIIISDSLRHFTSTPYPAIVRHSADAIDSFFQQHPFCPITDYDCPSTSDWRGRNTFYSYLTMIHNTSLGLYKYVRDKK